MWLETVQSSSIKSPKNKPWGPMKVHPWPHSSKTFYPLMSHGCHSKSCNESSSSFIQVKD